MRYVYLVARILLGVVFVFSGYVKAIDPWGASIKFDDYLEAMGLLVLQPLSFYIANFLSIIELVAGYLLLFHIRMKWTAPVILLLMIFFTPLTLWLAVTGKVSDCGCFGDAIKMSDWGTFWKNIVLLVPTLIVFSYWRRFRTSIPKAKQRLLFIFGFLFSIGIVYYSYNHLPIIDFRPYKVGVNIEESMEIPANAPVDEYKTTLIYKKAGSKKAFDETNYPWQDTTWHFVDTRQELIRKGYEPPIHDFFLQDMGGNDITSDILSAKKALLVVSYKLEETNFTKLYEENGLGKLIAYAEKNNVLTYVLTSSTKEQIQNLNAFISGSLQFATADEKMLKTMIRANPGIVLLNEGIIIGKWSYNDVPEKVDFERKDIVEASEIVMRKENSKGKYLSVLLFASLIIVTLVILKINKDEKKNYCRKLENEQES